MDPSWYACTALELAKLVRRRIVSPIELVDAHIARIRAVNPELNALVADRFPAARAEAIAQTEDLSHRRSNEELPPLFGLPCTIKEFFAVSGLPQTGGLVIRRGRLATEDAVVVQRLRHAGAIVLGVTNVPEGGLWLESDNRVYGRTNNPWDLRRTSGGSSGGEAALLATGASAFGMGSDIGGSIRLPAAFCGVVGHKPTARMVPNTGHWPPLTGNHRVFQVCGPLARSVGDLMPLMRVIAGPEREVGELVKGWVLGDPDEVDLRQVTVHVIDNRHFRTGPAMRRALDDARRALERRGARVKSLELKAMGEAFWIWAAMMSEVAAPSYAEILSGKRELPVMRELMKLALGRSAHTAPALIVVAAEGIVKYLPKARAQRLRELGRSLQRELEEVLGPEGVLLHPPYTRPAPLHLQPLLTPFDGGHTALFNVLEFPVTQVPTGLDVRGLPLGVQIIARRGNDHLTIAVAAALESEFGRLTPIEPRRVGQPNARRDAAPTEWREGSAA